MSQKLSLQWNDFEENTKSAFRNSRQGCNFSDVTLACEDGQQVEAHKLILNSSSPVFQKILEMNKHPHQLLIYLRGVKSVDISAILDFIYFGEANVYEENLDSFLVLAEELQLKGLVGKIEDKVEAPQVVPDEKNLPSSTPQVIINPEAKIPQNSVKAKIPKAEKESSAVTNTRSFSGEFTELEETVRSMMEKSQDTLPHRPGIKAYICNICGKQGQCNAIKDHIESKHLEGISVPCNHCDKTFRSKNCLRVHKRHCLSSH